MAVNLLNPIYLRGAAVTGELGTHLGEVDNVYLDTRTGKAEWASIRTGMFGSRVSLVPLAAASYRNGTLHLPYSRDHIEKAPHHDPEQELSVQDEQDVFTHYGVAREGGASEPGQDQSARPTHARPAPPVSSAIAELTP